MRRAGGVIILIIHKKKQERNLRLDDFKQPYNFEKSPLKFHIEGLYLRIYLIALKF